MNKTSCMQNMEKSLSPMNFFLRHQCRVVVVLYSRLVLVLYSSVVFVAFIKASVRNSCIKVSVGYDQLYFNQFPHCCE